MNHFSFEHEEVKQVYYWDEDYDQAGDKWGKFLPRENTLIWEYFPVEQDRNDEACQGICRASHHCEGITQRWEE